ncbi:MAG: potassium channel family protein, partial [Dehalococcoidia bacterium]
IETSVLAPLILKRLGVPRVVAKATSELHGEVLRRVGADQVIFPERDAGVRLAHTLAVPGVDDYISLSPTSGIAKFAAPPNLIGRTLAESQASCGAQISVVALKRGRFLITTPSLEERIQERDALVVIGPDPEIEAFVEVERTESRP